MSLNRKRTASDAIHELVAQQPLRALPSAQGFITRYFSPAALARQSQLATNTNNAYLAPPTTTSHSSSLPPLPPPQPPITRPRAMWSASARDPRGGDAQDKVDAYTHCIEALHGLLHAPDASLREAAAFDDEIMTTMLSDELKTRAIAEGRTVLKEMLDYVVSQRTFIVNNINTTGTTTGSTAGGRIKGTCPALVARCREAQDPAVLLAALLFSKVGRINRNEGAGAGQIPEGMALTRLLNAGCAAAERLRTGGAGQLDAQMRDALGASLHVISCRAMLHSYLHHLLDSEQRGRGPTLRRCQTLAGLVAAAQTGGVIGWLDAMGALSASASAAEEEEEADEPAPKKHKQEETSGKTPWVEGAVSRSRPDKVRYSWPYMLLTWRCAVRTHAYIVVPARPAFWRIAPY